MELMKDLDNFEYVNSNLEDQIKSIKPQLYRVLLYFALKAARIDGLSEDEVSKALEFAKLTGLDESTAKSIENILNLEDEISKLKHSILAV